MLTTPTCTTRTPRTAVRMTTILGVAALTAAAVRAAEVPSSPYLNYVYKYANAMLEHGRDTYGPVKTELFLSALDRTTLAPLTTRPAPPAGIRRGDRVGEPWEPLIGANPHLDQNFLRLLYAIKGLSGDDKYPNAADHELKWFLENAASEKTNLLPWGEHMYWNVMTDEAGPKDGESVHEFARPWRLWDRCFEIAPEASKRFALALWEHQIADHKTGAFDRHAGYWKHDARNGMDFPRHAGFFIRTWADAYAHTQDPIFLTAIETLVGRYEKNRHPATGMFASRTGKEDYGITHSLSIAIDCAGAARRVPEPLRARLDAFAEREDEIFCKLPHDVPGTGGFINTADRATAKPGAEVTPVWDAHYGGATTASIGMMCVARYENGGSPAYRPLITAAADAYLDSLPAEDLDAWPGTFGQAISLELAAFRLNAKREYLDRARALGLMAIKFFLEDNPLPRASLKTGHYESITGADTLMLALLEVHLTSLHITAIDPPANTIDR